MRAIVLRAVAVTALVFITAVGAAAQGTDTAYVPFVVNVDATVTAQQGEKAVSMTVMANVEKTLAIPFGGTNSIWNTGGTQGRLNAPIITNSRGNITLHLPPQSYQNAEIALHTVNGKRVLRAKAAASETVSGVSRRNVAPGVYMLSVKGTHGSAITTRLTHGGGNLNIIMAFGGENVSPDRRLGKKAVAEDWEITVSAIPVGYHDSTYTLNLAAVTYATQNITLLREYTAPTYTVTFNANGAVGTAPASIAADSGNSVTLPDVGNLTKDGYNFGGWNTNNSGTGTNYNPGSTYTPTANITLYAYWTALPTYTITFNANGGTVSSATGTTGTDGKLASLPTPTRTGYTFNGWHTATTGGTVVTTSTVFSANATIYAQWTLNTYTVTFNVNGGNGSVPPSQNVQHGSRITLPDGSELSKSGYIFCGWNTTSDGSKSNVGSLNYVSAEIRYYDYIVNGNVILYAIWKVEPTPTITTFTDSRDGKTYRKVAIGSQVWMAENLNYDIPNVTSDVCYQHSADSCAKYGRLYKWSTAMDIDTDYNYILWGGSDVKHQGACPVGWHIPSDAEWTVLTDAIGGLSAAGTKLKSSTGWEYSFNSIPAGTNEYGFSALPASHRHSDDRFGGSGIFGTWWSATEYDADNAWNRGMGYGYEYVDRSNVYDGGKRNSFSVRCVQDE